MLAATLAGALLLSTTACGLGKSTADDPPANPASAPVPVRRWRATANTTTAW
jgi:hypothetical protein